MVKKSNSFKNLIFISLFICCHFSYSQNNAPKSIDELVELSEMYYGTDDRLLNGYVSTISNTNAVGHPFFLTEEWIIGDVFMDGGEFHQVALKYNIELDEIYFIGKNKNGPTPIIILNKNLIDSVRLENHLFINANRMPIQNQVGFIEVLYSGNLTSYLKHKIPFIIKSTSTYQYIEYREPKSVIYLSDKNGLIGVRNKKDFLNKFDPFQKDIVNFMHKNKIRFNKANHNQLYRLLEYCDELSSN